MNPSSGETSGINLPPPVAEQKPGGSGDASVAPEQARPATPEMARTPAPAFPVPTPGQTGLPAPQGSSDNDAISTTSQAGSPVLDDGDKVEKEWVGKAKRIIDQNQHDPYKKSEGITLLKADYMKQQYNKIIKIEK